MTAQILDDETRRFGRLLHYAGVLAAVLSATAVYTLFHVPAAERIDEVSMRLNEIMLSVQNAPVIREQHEKVSARLEAVKARIAAVESRVPQSADAGEFLKQLSQIALEEELSIQNFNPEKPITTPGYVELEITLHGRGSFASICTFLDRLNRLPRLSKVKNLKVTSVSQAAEYPLEATFVIYFALRGKDLPPKEAPHG